MLYLKFLMLIFFKGSFHNFPDKFTNPHFRVNSFTCLIAYFSQAQWNQIKLQSCVWDLLFLWII